MSSMTDRTLTVFALIVILNGAFGKPQQQSYLPPLSGQAQSSNNQPTFYAPPAQGHQQQQQIPFAAAPTNEQQFLTQAPIQLQIPIPNDGVQEKKIYVQLPPQQQYPQQQQPQYSYPLRKHYKIILVRSPSPATPPPAPILPEIEEQTLVYVLVKKPDSPSVAELQQQQQQSFKLNKPEVYFIKYKANEASGSAGSSHPQALGNSIEQQQLSNNLGDGGSSHSGGGGGYSYDATRKREAKNFEQDEPANKVENQQ